MANNSTALRTELLGVLTSTTNLDAATKTKIRDAFASLYNPEYLVYLNGTADTATKKGEFAIIKTFGFWKNAVEQASYNANQAALPAPDTIVG